MLVVAIDSESQRVESAQRKRLGSCIFNFLEEGAMDSVEPPRSCRLSEAIAFDGHPCGH
jgi:hypothetical protein